MRGVPHIRYARPMRRCRYYRIRGGTVTVTTPANPISEPIPEPFESDGARRGTILCGVDDSPGASAALDAAAELSRRLDLRLVVVTVAEAIVDDDGRPIESLSTTQAREGARKLLRRLVDEARIPAGSECRYDVGTPA